MKLNEREQFILIEALEAWEEQPMANSMRSAMMGTMLGAVVHDDDGVARKKMQNEIATKKVEAEAEEINRKREVIMLKAKIISANGE